MSGYGPKVADELKGKAFVDSEKLKPANKTRRLIAVYGKELDQHDGQLCSTSSGGHLF